MGTQVITRDTGRRLGVVGEVIVDIDRREVVAVGLRDNPLTRFPPGLPRWMPLDRIRQVGDVILVDSADSSENFNPERYSRVINCQVITESGEQLGRVLGFAFDIETGELTTLVMGALGVPLLGEGVLSTWEMPVEEIVSSGPDRIIVYEGAEDKLKQLNSGVLEKLESVAPAGKSRSGSATGSTWYQWKTSSPPDNLRSRNSVGSKPPRPSGLRLMKNWSTWNWKTGVSNLCNSAATSMSPSGTTSGATRNLPAMSRGRLSAHGPTTSHRPTTMNLLMRNSRPTRNSLPGVPCRPPAVRFSNQANLWTWSQWRTQLPLARPRISTIPGEGADGFKGFQDALKSRDALLTQ